jgi:hypothetical protein
MGGQAHRESDRQRDRKRDLQQALKETVVGHHRAIEGVIRGPGLDQGADVSHGRADGFGQLEELLLDVAESLCEACARRL